MSHKELVFIGDVHLERDDPCLEAFLAFLDRLRERAARVVLLGDLFDLWIGGMGIEGPHHLAVTAKLAELRAEGVVVRYVEGNRDYRIGKAWAGRAFDEAHDRGFAESFAGRSLFAVHGDLVNPHDRPYRAWRKFSRSAAFWAAFRLLPRALRRGVARGLERRMRSTNIAHKSRFPEEEIRLYAAAWLGRGHDAVVLGHFHLERDIEALPPSPPGRILVLPEWRESRRHLAVAADGRMRFVDSSG